MIEEKQVKEMLPDEIERIIKFLQEILGYVSTDKKTVSKLINREKEEHCCPYCYSKEIVKNGKSKNGVQRYKCKTCTRRFSDTTNTICSHSKLTYDMWLKYFECMTDRLSIRKTADKLGLNKNTVFAMRHKVLNALKLFREDKKLSGEIQMDEKYESINLKGTKPSNMPRYSKPRKSQGNSKRGTSNHQICIASAIDEFDNMYFEIVGSGPITTEMAEKAFKNRIAQESTIITDCKSSYEKFAKDNKCKLEQVKSGTYQNLNGYNLSEINALHSNLENFMKLFLGVSTKHLQGYLDWFVYQKYLNYTIEILKQPQVLMNYVISKPASIKISDVYSKKFPVNLFDIYSDYNFVPSPHI